MVGSLICDDTVHGVYLHHGSELGEFSLCSDSVIPTFTRWDSLRRITELFTEEENEAFRTSGYTIGGMMVFPGNRIHGKQTINCARWFNRKIADRFDLTLECIRRHYRTGPRQGRRYGSWKIRHSHTSSRPARRPAA